MCAQYKLCLVYNSPPYEIGFAKRHIMHSSHKEFSKQDLHEVIILLRTQHILLKQRSRVESYSKRAYLTCPMVLSVQPL